MQFDTKIDIDKIDGGRKHTESAVRQAPLGEGAEPLDALRGRDGGVRFALQVLLLLQDDCGAPPDVVLPEELHTVAAHF